MKVTMGEAFQINEVFQSFIEQKLAFNLSYKIMKLLTSLENDIKFYNQKVQELLDNYAKKDEEGKYIENNGSISIQEDKFQEFQKAYQEIQECEIELPNIKFTMEELNNLEISPKEAYALKSIIEE